MRKFAANYLVTPTGIFLKNGILITSEDGSVIECIDTKGNLREIAQLTFLNGILFSEFIFVRLNTERTNSAHENPVSSIVQQTVAGLSQLSFQNLIEIGKQVQLLFPEMTIRGILNEISEVLISEGEFRKENKSGIFLLSGADLVELHFNSKCKLKMIV